MKKLETNCYGISITYEPSNTDCAVISSNMKETNTEENKKFNAAVDGIESLILAHFCAGYDITSGAYLEGIETAYNAIANQLINNSNENVVTIEKKREVSGNSSEIIHYQVNESDWVEAIKRYNDEEIALKELERQLKTKRTLVECEIESVAEEFDVTVTEI